MALTTIEQQYHPIRELFLVTGREALVHELRLCFLSEPQVNKWNWICLEHDNSRLIINITDSSGHGKPSDDDMQFSFYDRMNSQFLKDPASGKPIVYDVGATLS